MAGNQAYVSLEEEEDEGRRKVKGAFVMLGLALVLVYVPLFNGVVAGVAGGRIVGGKGRAPLIALLPAWLAAAFFWVLYEGYQVPVYPGLFARFTPGALVAVSSLGIVLGAALGGVLPRRR